MGQDDGVAARSGNAQAEHVADAAEITAAGMEFVQDPVLTLRHHESFRNHEIVSPIRSSIELAGMVRIRAE